MWADLTEDVLAPSTAYQNVIDAVTALGDWTFVRHPGIVTNDDAVIELWQVAPIPGKSLKKGNLRAGQKAAFLLGHDMRANGVSWVSNGADSIAFQLAAEHDVWILHDRSTSVSSAHHLNLDINDPIFWDFDFEEIGENEIKAAIDYIQDNNKLQVDKWDKVSYVGHGSGAASALSALAKDNAYFSANVAQVIALAPTLRMNAASLLLVEASHWVYPVLNHIYTKGYNYVNESNVVIDFTGDEQALRSDNDWFEFSLGNENDVDVVLEQVSRWVDEWLATWANWGNVADNAWGYTFTANTSMKIMNHYSQIMKELDALCFNYLDNDINFAAYGQTEPPQIPLGNIMNVPVMLVAASDDIVAAPSDVMWLQSVMAPNYTGEAAADLAYWNISGGHNTALQGTDMSYWAAQVEPFIDANIP